jgi:hypothetical protein
VGLAYLKNMTAGGQAPYTFSVFLGSLPPAAFTCRVDHRHSDDRRHYGFTVRVRA